MKFLIVFTLTLLATFVSGCIPSVPKLNTTAFNRLKKNSNPPAVTETKEEPLQPSQLIEKSLGGYRSLSTLQSSVALKMIDEPNQFTLRCKARLLVGRPQQLRLSATKGIGMEILDISMAGERLEILLPRKNRLYRGSIDDLAGTGISFHPVAIVNMLLLNADQWKNRSWTQKQKDDQILLVENITTGPREILVFSRETLFLLEQMVVSGSDDIILKVMFSDHQPMGNDSFQYPRRMIISFPQEKQEITMILRDPEANPALSESDYLLDPQPEGIDIRALATIHQNGEGPLLTEEELSKEDPAP